MHWLWVLCSPSVPLWVLQGRPITPWAMTRGYQAALLPGTAQGLWEPQLWGHEATGDDDLEWGGTSTQGHS